MSYVVASEANPIEENLTILKFLLSVNSRLKNTPRVPLETAFTRLVLPDFFQSIVPANIRSRAGLERN